MKDVEPTRRGSYFWPSSDFEVLQLEPLASFVEPDVEGASVDSVAKEWFDRLDEALVATITIIRRTMHELDVDLACKASLPAAVGVVACDPDHILSLATTVFVVGKTEDSTVADVYVYFGREVILAARLETVDRFKDIAFGQPLPASFSDVGNWAVLRILEMCGLKTSTTILELDRHDAHFVCMSCEPILDTPVGNWRSAREKVPCRQVLSWRTAVSHPFFLSGDTNLYSW